MSDQAERVGRKEIAARLGISARQVDNLVKGHPDFPSKLEKGKRSFPPAECQKWYVAFKQREAVARAKPKATTDLDAIELREKEAAAGLKEIKLAQLRGELVRVGELEAAIEGVLQRLRSRIVSMPGEYAARLPGGASMADKVQALREISVSLLDELRIAGRVPKPKAGEAA